MLLVSAAGCRSSGAMDARVPSSARAWAAGPVRWLMTDDEARRFARLRSGTEALGFIESFWQRRDPDPQAPGNPFAEEFFRRVQEADLLYTSEEAPGSLTDRGRAFILLGPPSRVALEQRRAPRLDALGGSGRAAPPAGGEQVSIEVWGYAPGDLTEALSAALAAAGLRPTVEVSFLVGRGGSRLLRGGEFLEIAALASLRSDL